VTRPQGGWCGWRRRRSTAPTALAPPHHRSGHSLCGRPPMIMVRCHRLWRYVQMPLWSPWCRTGHLRPPKRSLCPPSVDGTSPCALLLQEAVTAQASSRAPGDSLSSFRPGRRVWLGPLAGLPRPAGPAHMERRRVRRACAATPPCARAGPGGGPPRWTARQGQRGQSPYSPCERSPAPRLWGGAAVGCRPSP
jgi:hypothetical protein